MLWYVKTQHGEVIGPMSQKYAEVEVDKLNGSVMYSERIFEPEFVTTDEVETLVAEMRSASSLRTMVSLRISPDQLYLDAQSLLRRAVDAITLLSKKKDCPVAVSRKEIGSLLADLEREAEKPGGSLRDSGLSYALRRAHTTIISLLREKSDLEGKLESLDSVQREDRELLVEANKWIQDSIVHDSVFAGCREGDLCLACRLDAHL